MKIIDVQALRAQLAQRAVQLVDVRTDEELAIAALPQTHHIPMDQLPARMQELNPAAPIAVLCHHGVRSEAAARFLERNGFADVSSVAGGIEAWSLQVDPTVPRY